MSTKVKTIKRQINQVKEEFKQLLRSIEAGLEEDKRKAANGIIDHLSYIEKAIDQGFLSGNRPRYYEFDDGNL